MITDKYLIREQNEALVLQTIIEQEGLSRAKVSEITGLNKATVSSICTTLIENGLVEETGIGNSGKTGGRKPIFLSFKAQSGLSIAFDLGYNYVSGAISYLDGTMIAEFRERHLVTKENVIAILQKSIEHLRSQSPETLYGIVGMTLAIHGIVVDHQIVFAPFYDLNELSLQADLEKLYDFPVYLENEANLTAIGEFTFSHARDNLISISIHSGVGAGIIQDKTLQTGSHGQAGEIGHTILYPDGIPCRCGNHGCLEKYASNLAIYQQLGQHYGLETVDSDTLTDYLKKEDAFTLELIAQQIAHQAIGVNNLTTLFDPQLIVINSSLYMKNPELLRQLQSHLSSAFTQKVELMISQRGDTATLYGGIAVAVKNFLNIPELTFAHQ